MWRWTDRLDGQPWVHTTVIFARDGSPRGCSAVAVAVWPSVSNVVDAWTRARGYTGNVFASSTGSVVLFTGVPHKNKSTTRDGGGMVCTRSCPFPYNVF